MLAYLLFIVGLIIIIFALSSPKRESEFSLAKENSTNIEDVSKEMISQLEKVAKNFLFEIDQKSVEIKELVEEADFLLKKIEIARKDYLSLSKKIRTVSPLEEKHQRIVQLMDEGKDIVEVAKTMKMGKGEIQLILDLAKTGWKNFENN